MGQFAPSSDQRPLSSRPWFVAVFIGLALSVMLVQRFSSDTGDVAVFVNPWGPASAAGNTVIAAGGLIVGAGSWPFVILARPNSKYSDGFSARLYHAGAILVIKPGFMTGCFSKV